MLIERKRLTTALAMGLGDSHGAGRCGGRGSPVAPSPHRVGDGGAAIPAVVPGAASVSLNPTTFLSPNPPQPLSPSPFRGSLPSPFSPLPPSSAQSTATSSRKPSWVSSPYQEGILFLPAPLHSAWVAARTTTITHEACTLLLKGSRQRGITPMVESHQSRPQTQGSEPINLGWGGGRAGPCPRPLGRALLCG